MLAVIARGTKSSSRSRPGALALAGGLLASSVAPALAAREKSFALSWSAPAECPSEAEVEAYVARDLGATAEGRTVVRARGTVATESDGRYRVALELDTGGASSSRRELAGVSCEAVSQAAALVVALTIRAEAEPEAKPAPEPPREPAPRATTNRHARPFLAAAVTNDVGSLPKPAVGLAISGGVSLGWLRLEPGLAYYLPESVSIAETGEGAHFTLGSASLRACVPFQSGALWLAPCLGGGIDLLHASGFGTDEPRAATTFDGFGAAALLGGWDISPIISARLDVQAVLPLARPVFVVDDADSSVHHLYERGSFALRSQLGLELHF